MESLEKIAQLHEMMVLEDPDPPLIHANKATTLAFRGERAGSAVGHPCLTHQEFPIFQAKVSGGKCVPILKAMLTMVCERNCNYCCFRAGHDIPRQSFSPDEFADAVMKLTKRGYIRGVLLSSGIAGGGVRTQDRLLAAAEILRRKRNYKGYLHLKLMPGVEKAQVEQAIKLSDRVSINLEAPTEDTLNILAPMKRLKEELVQGLRWVEEFRQCQQFEKGLNQRWVSSTTQFVIGAAGESDLDLMRTSDYLHRVLNLGRVYYSRFQPVEGTPLEGLSGADPLRQARLYQADFLLRDYGFSFNEIPFEGDGNLSLDEDPKLKLAKTQMADRPVEINTAGRWELLRVPGIGNKVADTILKHRGTQRLKDISDLRKLGIHTKRLEPFILLNGKRPSYQRTLW